MNRISEEELNRLRHTYTRGSRVELDVMDDFQAPPPGTRGTVKKIDDTGNILVSWDNGSSLNVLYGIDVCHLVKEN